MSWLIVFLATLWILTLFIAFLLLGVLRSVSLLNWRLDYLSAITPTRVGRAGLKLGKKAPDFSLPNVKGDLISLRDFVGRKVLLVFLQPGCGPCNRIVSDLNQYHENQLTSLLVIQRGNPEEVRKWAEEKGVRFPVVLQDKQELSRKYEMFATPFAFLVDEHGVIQAKGIINDGKQIHFVVSARTGAESMEQTDKENLETQDSVEKAHNSVFIQNGGGP